MFIDMPPPEEDDSLAGVIVIGLIILGLFIWWVV